MKQVPGRRSLQRSLPTFAARSAVSLVALVLASGAGWAACGPADVTVSAGTYQTGQTSNANSSINFLVQSGVTINTTDGTPVGDASDGVHVVPVGATTPFLASNGSNCAETQGQVSINVGSVGAIDRDGIRVLSVAPGTAAAGDAAVYTSAGTTINVSNEFGDGIIARSSDQYDFGASGRGAGSVTVESLGAINISGNSASGITARGGGAFTDVTVGGNITLTAANAGISSAGFINSSAGIFAQNRNRAAGLGSVSVLVNNNAVISTIGTRSVGISAASENGGTVLVDTKTASVITSGDYSAGIRAQSANGAITVNAGKIDTDGLESDGIVAQSGSNGGLTTFQPTFGTSNAPPLFVLDPALNPLGTGSAVSVTTAGNITAIGKLSVGILAASNGAQVDVTVNNGDSVMGGWEANVGDLAAFSGLPPSGVVLGSGAGTSATLHNFGNVGALSDRAVASAENYQEHFTNATINDLQNGTAAVAGNDYSDDGAPIVVENDGTITGFVELGTGADVFNNRALMAQRDFADTNGGGVRDTERVSVSDFGAGADSFDNAGTVSLQTVPAATVDTATHPQYVPVALTGGYAPGFYDITRTDVEQGDLLNLETFSNSGVITMQDAQTGGTAAVAGDVLYISANGKADGTAGTGTFITYAGSSLRLDTVLNQGSAANSMSDVLVVDGTQVRSGPTTIYVAKAGGVGASTDLNNNGLVDEGEGILVVEVLDASRSAEGAFNLAGNAVLNGTFGNHTYANEGVIIDGAYAYRLAGPGSYDVAAAPSSGDWYLVNQLAPTTPIYETPPDQITPPTLQQRVGNRYWKQPAQKVFCKDASQNYQCAPTAAQTDSYADKSGDGRNIAEDSALWVRMEGAHGHNEPRVSTTSQTYDDNQWNLEAGLDGLLHKDDQGDLLIGGLTAHYGQSSKDVMSALGDGTVDNTGYGVGATLTWYERNGFYADAQGLVSWYSRDMSSDQLGSLVKGNDGFGYALSLEAGKRIDLNDTWTLTPQAQLVYASVDFDSFTDPFGATVDPQRADSLKGRLGLSADHENSWQDDAGKTRRTHVYGITNLTYEFLGESDVKVSGVKLVSEPERLWGEIGLGGTYSWDDGRYALNGEVNTSTSLASFGDSYKFGGTVGLSISW